MKNRVSGTIFKEDAPRIVAQIFEDLNKCKSDYARIIAIKAELFSFGEVDLSHIKTKTETIMSQINNKISALGSDIKLIQTALELFPEYQELLKKLEASQKKLENGTLISDEDVEVDCSLLLEVFKYELVRFVEWCVNFIKQLFKGFAASMTMASSGANTQRMFQPASINADTSRTKASLGEDDLPNDQTDYKVEWR